MTRLRDDWLRDLDKALVEYDQSICSLIGMDLTALAFRAAGLPKSSRQAAQNQKAAVIRVRTGEGVIGYFAESVAAVARHMGLDVFIPDACDVAGIYEALSRGAELLVMADDDRFIAFHTKTGAVGENDEATVSGYVTGLSALAGGLAGKEVLLLGYGRIGQKALVRLLAEGAAVSVYDCDEQKTIALRQYIEQINALGTDAATVQALPENPALAKALSENPAETQGLPGKRVKLLSDRPRPLRGLVFDATSQGGYLSMQDLAEDALIAAPGVPLSLDKEAEVFCRARKQLMHDPLQTGTAVMLALALKDVL